MVNYLATRLGGALSAAVCFYGSAPDTQHGFNNDTRPRYDVGAAKGARGRTLAFFQKSLR